MPLIWWVRSILFLSAAIPICLYAMSRGGEPERAAAAMVAAAIVATELVPFHRYDQVVVALAAIDGALFVGMVALALVADRFWPMYFAAIQAVTLMIHVGRLLAGSILPEVYARFAGELAYPALAVLAIGTWRHRRRRPERDWAWEPAPRDPLHLP